MLATPNHCYIYIIKKIAPLMTKPGVISVFGSVLVVTF